MPQLSNFTAAMATSQFSLSKWFLLFPENPSEVIPQKICHCHKRFHGFMPIFRQWFIDTKKLQEKALECLPDVQFLLESGYGSMKSMLKARPYWCISRQRVWGVPIPVFFHKYDYLQIFIFLSDCQFKLIS